MKRIRLIRDCAGLRQQVGQTQFEMAASPNLTTKPSGKNYYK